jgi:hypothetical protein
MNPQSHQREDAVSYDPFAGLGVGLFALFADETERIAAAPRVFGAATSVLITRWKWTDLDKL